jgi:hypothetical protein
MPGISIEKEIEINAVFLLSPSELAWSQVIK